MDNLYELVKSMRTLNINKDKCIKEKNILKKLIFCKYYLSSQQYGPLLEKYIETERECLRIESEVWAGRDKMPVEIIDGCLNQDGSWVEKGRSFPDK